MDFVPPYRIRAPVEKFKEDPDMHRTRTLSRLSLATILGFLVTGSITQIAYASPACTAAESQVEISGVTYVLKTIGPTAETCSLTIPAGDFVVLLTGGGGGGGGGASSSGGRGGGGGGGGGEFLSIGGTANESVTVDLFVGSGGAGGIGGIHDGAAATSGASGTDSSISGIGPVYIAEGGSGGAAGTNVGGQGGVSGSGKPGGTFNGTIGGQGGSTLNNGSNGSTSINPGDVQSFTGVSIRRGSGGGGGSFGIWGSDENTPGSGGKGARGSLDTVSEKYGYTGGSGRSGEIIIRYPVPTTPGTPGTPTVTAGDGTARIIPVAPDSGGTPESYRVTASPGGSFCDVVLPATYCDISGLTNGTEYSFTVTATNTAGTSSASTAATATPTRTPPRGGSSPQVTPESTSTFTVKGFVKGQAKLSKAIRESIRSEFASISNPKNVTCTGTVRGKKWNVNRKNLATLRATNVCKYIQTISPNVSTQLKKRLVKSKTNSKTVILQIIY